MKLFTAIPAVLLLFTTATQAQTQNNDQQQELLKTNAYMMHGIEALQQARLETAYGTAAKTTNTSERLIGHSTYMGGEWDSASYSYSGDRHSTFDFNSMQYQPPAYVFNTMPMNMTGNITTYQHNDGSSILFDSSWYTDITGYVQLQLAQYDANNNITQFYGHYVLDSDSLLTFQYERFINTYNADGNITSYIEFNWDAGVWDTVTRRTLTYTGNTIASDTFAVRSESTGTWKEMYFWSYSYDNSGNLINVDKYSATGANSSWEETERYLFYYNPDNTIQKDTVFIVDGASSILNTTDSVGYTTGVNYITYEQVAQYSNGQTSTTTQYVHIANDLPDTLYNTVEVVSNQIQSAFKTAYTYDSYNNPLVASQYDYITNGIYNNVPSAVDYYYYQQYTTAVNNVVKQNVNITVYPNPAMDEINISQTGIQQGALTYITLINALGQTVHSESLPWMNSTETISLGGLVPGNYWLIIQDKGGSVLSRQAIVKK